MEAEDAVPLIKFWLAVQSFQLSAQTPQTDQKSTREEEHKDDEEDVDDRVSLASSVGQHEEEPTPAKKSPNHCDIEDRPLTDDEKSEIIQDKRAKKQQKQQENHHEEPNKVHKQRTKNNSRRWSTTVATDAIKIFEKFLCSSSDSCLSDIPATIQSTISLSLCNCDSATLVSPYCFAEAQQFVLERMEREYLRRFLDSEFYCKYCVEILTSDDLRLADLLYSDCALFYFMEFLEQAQTRDFLDFWMSATNFRRDSTACPVAERRTDAMVLYDKYFSLQATNSLQLSDTVRSQVEERICSTEERVLVTCFDLPIRIVERVFTDFYLDKFLASELFYKHLMELVNRSQAAVGVINGGDVKHPRVQRTQSLTKEREMMVRGQHKKSNSLDGREGLRRANSTISISSQNTLLAMESAPPLAGGGSRRMAEDMKIDSRMFYNADLLWKRWQQKPEKDKAKSSSSLSFGRVNALGRFERDFDWDEGRAEERQQSAGSRLKKAVKKLVHLPEDKVQEELAWQVAEMIVKDVTDITLNGGGGGGGGAEQNGQRRASGGLSVSLTVEEEVEEEV